MDEERVRRIAFVGVIAIALALRVLFFLSPSHYVEESIAALMARDAVSKRLVPYQDFFLSHPPGTLLLDALSSQALPLGPPLLAPKLTSLLISVLILWVLWRKVSPLSAALFASGFSFFHWFSLSLPLLPLSLFLLLAHFGLREKRQGLANLFILGALLSEFSGALYPIFLLFLDPKSLKKLLPGVVLAFLLFLALSASTGGEFQRQSVESQTAGRGNVNLQANSLEIFSSILVYTLPLILLSLAFAAKTRGKGVPLLDEGLLFAGFSAAALALLFPGLSNNTAQFIVPFLAASAGKFRGRFDFLIPAALLLSSAYLLASSGQFDPRTANIREISGILAREKNSSVWGTPDYSLYALYSGNPVEGNSFDSLPTTIPLTGAKTPDFLIISDYFSGMADYYNPSDYSENASFTEPVLGNVRVFRRKT